MIKIYLVEFKTLYKLSLFISDRIDHTKLWKITSSSTLPTKQIKLKLMSFKFSYSQDEALNNITKSTLNFVPTTEDDGKSITCRAENPKVSGLFLETTWKIEVICKFLT